MPVTSLSPLLGVLCALPCLVFSASRSQSIDKRSHLLIGVFVPAVTERSGISSDFTLTHSLLIWFFPPFSPSPHGRIYQQECVMLERSDPECALCNSVINVRALPAFGLPKWVYFGSNPSGAELPTQNSQTCLPKQGNAGWGGT